MRGQQTKKVQRHVGVGLALLFLFSLFLVGCEAEEGIEQKLAAEGRAKGGILPGQEDYYGVFALDDNNAWVVGSRGVILHLTGKGEEVSLLNSGVEKALYDVDFIDPRNGLAIGQEGLILKTTDGGKSWRQIPVELHLEEWQAASPHFFDLSRGSDPNKVWVVGPVGTVIHSADGGETWENRSLPPPPEQISGRFWDLTVNGVSFVSDAEGWLVGEFGVILHTTDGGRTWEQQENVLNLPKFTRPDLSEEEALRQRIPPLHLEDLYLLDVAFLNPQEGYIAGETGILLETRDGGKTWTNVPSGSINTLLSVAALAFGNRRIEVATGVLGTLAMNENGKWEILPEMKESVLTWIRDVGFAKNGRFGLACGGRGTILLTEDRGRMWRKMDVGKLARAAARQPA